MCMKVWEKLVEKMGVEKFAWCVKERKEKNIEKRHMKKNLKEKKGEKKEKFKSKEYACCEENRSISENEGKMGQQDDICP